MFFKVNEMFDIVYKLIICFLIGYDLFLLDDIFHTTTLLIVLGKAEVRAGKKE